MDSIQLVLQDLSNQNYDDLKEKVRSEKNSSKIYDYIRSIILNIPTKTEPLVKLFKDDCLDVNMLEEILSGALETAKNNEDSNQIYSVLRMYYIINEINFIKSNVADAFAEIGIPEKFIATNIEPVSDPIKEIEVEINFEDREKLKNDIFDKYRNDNEFVVFVTYKNLDYTPFHQSIEIIKYLNTEELTSVLVNNTFDITISIKIFSRLLLIEGVFKNFMKKLCEMKTNNEILCKNSFNEILRYIWCNHLCNSEDNDMIVKFKSLLDDESIEHIKRLYSRKKLSVLLDLPQSETDYKVNDDVTDNELYQCIKNKDYRSINDLPRDKFFVDFFNLVDPSISHFLRYTELLYDFLELNDEEKKMFQEKIKELSIKRPIYGEVVMNKLKNAKIL